MRVDVCWLDSITRSFSTEVPTYLPGYLRVLVQVWRDEPVLRGAVAAVARVSELRAARDATGREHAAAITMREQENAGLRAEFVQHRHEQGGVQEQLEADRRALSGRVASLQEQAAQLEREKHEGTEEIEQWREGKVRFVRGRGLGGWDRLQLNKDLHTRRDSRVPDLLSLHTTERWSSAPAVWAPSVVLHSLRRSHDDVSQARQKSKWNVS